MYNVSHKNAIKMNSVFAEHCYKNEQKQKIQNSSSCKLGISDIGINIAK